MPPVSTSLWACSSTRFLAQWAFSDPQQKTLHKREGEKMCRASLAQQEQIRGVGTKAPAPMPSLVQGCHLGLGSEVWAPDEAGAQVAF